MKNYQRYQQEIIKYMCGMINKEQFKKATGFWDNFVFDNMDEWLKSEYERPVRVSKFAYYFLNKLDECGYKYLARDKDKELYCYKSKPNKDRIMWGVNSVKVYDSIIYDLSKDFYFVNWEDEHPTLIKKVLANCEVLEDE